MLASPAASSRLPAANASARRTTAAATGFSRAASAAAATRVAASGWAGQDCGLGPDSRVPREPQPGVPGPPEGVVEAHGEAFQRSHGLAAVEQVERVEGGCPAGGDAGRRHLARGQQVLVARSPLVALGQRDRAARARGRVSRFPTASVDARCRPARSQEARNRSPRSTAPVQVAGDDVDLEAAGQRRVLVVAVAGQSRPGARRTPPSRAGHRQPATPRSPSAGSR